MQIYISRDGQQFGPYEMEQAKQYLREGNLKETDLACHDGKNWVPLAQVPGITQGPMPPPAQPAKPVSRQGGKPTRPGIKAKSKRPSVRATRSPVRASLPDSATNKWMIFSYAGVCLTIICVFLPWYAVSVSSQGGSNSKSVNGFHDAVDNWGILTLIASIVAVVMTFFPQTKKFTTIPMGVAALAALIPVFTTESKSMNLFGTKMSAGTSWGLWLCLIFAVATSVFMFLQSKKNN
jgi:hypothetical protein